MKCRPTKSKKASLCNPEVHPMRHLVGLGARDEGLGFREFEFPRDHSTYLRDAYTTQSMTHVLLHPSLGQTEPARLFHLGLGNFRVRLDPGET